MCWLWVARQLAVAKDVRLMIADLIWYERAAQKLQLAERCSI